MRKQVLSAGFAVVVLSLLSTSRAAADESTIGGPPSLNDLSMEVAALQAFHQFRLTPAQLETLRKLAKETAPEPSERETAKASPAFRDTVTALRNALVEGDDELIDQLQDKLEDLAEKEKPELDDGIEVTDAARLRAPELIRFLSGRQIASYLASHTEEIPEPPERLREALGSVRKLAPAEWKEVRTAVSEEVARGVAGLDADKAARVADQVVQLLIQARGMKEEEFKTERPELEKMAREIVGNVGPLDVVRHFLAQDLAELLSNPRLAAAIDARRKR
jgi:hypothetical protein